jgi:predicted lactoylglutathione lyase
MIFVNLPVKNLEKSKAFWEAVGYSFNPQFTDENAGCLVISDTIFAMLLQEPFFQTFTTRGIADATQTKEVLLGLSAESREGVDQLVDKALAAGATAPKEAQDYGFMYQRSFEDLDGHLWEIIYMDPAHVQSS